MCDYTWQGEHQLRHTRTTTKCCVKKVVMATGDVISIQLLRVEWVGNYKPIIDRVFSLGRRLTSFEHKVSGCSCLYTTTEGGCYSFLFSLVVQSCCCTCVCAVPVSITICRVSTNGMSLWYYCNDTVTFLLIMRLLLSWCHTGLSGTDRSLRVIGSDEASLMHMLSEFVSIDILHPC